MEDDRNKLVLYTSHFCLHSLSVERLLDRHNVDVDIISIDGNPDARQQLIVLNDGFASVPTLLFADGTKLTEPSLTVVCERLGIEEESLGAKVRSIFSRSDE